LRTAATEPATEELAAAAPEAVQVVAVTAAIVVAANERNYEH
jgi:hypothetical protein